VLLRPLFFFPTFDLLFLKKTGPQNGERRDFWGFFFRQNKRIFFYASRNDF